MKSRAPAASRPDPARSAAPKLPRRRSSLLVKGLAVIAIPLLFEAGFSVALLHRQSRYEEAQDWAIHTKEVLTKVDEIVRVLLDIQSRQRGMILTGAPLFQLDIAAENQRVQRSFGELRALVRDNPRQAARLKGIFAQFDALLARYTQASALLAAGRREEVLQRVKSLTGQKMADALLADVDTFRATELRIDRERLDALKRQATLQNRMLIGGAAANVLLIAGVALFFTRGIVRRLSLIEENVERIGENRELAPAVGGRDEIAALDRAFHALAEDLGRARATEAQQRGTIERRAAELEEANRALDGKNREIEMFVYSVSHDLRSPLVNLQGFSKELGLTRADLLRVVREDFSPNARERAAALIERDMAESIHYIQTAVTRLGGIIDALLRVARAGRVELHPQEVDVGAVAARIIDALRATVTERGARVFIKNEMPRVWADPAAVEQIFANLIQNAVHYLDPARPGVVEIGSLDAAAPPDDSGTRVFYVKDNGRGIPAAALPKLFALFQRLHRADVPAGEGIGLTLARRIAERHGGRLWVESEEGVGSTFYVALPAAK